MINKYYDKTILFLTWMHDSEAGQRPANKKDVTYIHPRRYAINNIQNKKKLFLCCIVQG